MSYYSNHIYHSWIIQVTLRHHVYVGYSPRVYVSPTLVTCRFCVFLESEAWDSYDNVWKQKVYFLPWKSMSCATYLVNAKVRHGPPPWQRWHLWVSLFLRLLLLIIGYCPSNTSRILFLTAILMKRPTRRLSVLKIGFIIRAIQHWIMINRINWRLIRD